MYLLHCKEWSLRHLPWRGHGTVCWGGVKEGIVLLTWLSPHFPSLPLFPTSGLCPFRWWFPGGWACVHSRTLWVSPMNCPVRVRVSLATATSTGFTVRGFEALVFSCWDPGFHGLFGSLVVPPSLCAHECGKSHPPATTLPATASLTWPCALSTHAACLHPSYQCVWIFLL